MNSAQASSSIINNGYCYLPRLIDDHFLTRLRREAQYLIDYHPYLYSNAHDNSVQIGQIQRSRVFLNINKLLYSGLFFFNPFFIKTISKVLKTSPLNIAFNRQIISQRTFPSNAPPSNVIHWDRLRSIKIWVYLTDTPYDAGPIKIIPNTHIFNRAERISTLQGLANSGLLYDSIDNRSKVMSDNFSESYLPQSFSAGDVLMFDTDISHGARKVSNEHSRFILRSYSTLYSDLRFRSNILNKNQS